jgi:hypothetical protein
LSAFWLTVAPSCSIDAAVSSSVDAWSSVRADRSRLPWAICALAVATLSALPRTELTMRISDVCIESMAASSGLNSSRAVSTTGWVRSPSRTRSATACETAMRRLSTRSM